MMMMMMMMMAVCAGDKSQLSIMSTAQSPADTVAAHLPTYRREGSPIRDLRDRTSGSATSDSTN